jgi:hypothetical protein
MARRARGAGAQRHRLFAQAMAFLQQQQVLDRQIIELDARESAQRMRQRGGQHEGFEKDRHVRQASRRLPRHRQNHVQPAMAQPLDQRRGAVLRQAQRDLRHLDPQQRQQIGQVIRPQSLDRAQMQQPRQRPAPPAEGE